LVWASSLSAAPLLVPVSTPPLRSSQRSPRNLRSSPASTSSLRLRTTSRPRLTATLSLSSPAQCALLPSLCTRVLTTSASETPAHFPVSLRFTCPTCSQVLPSCRARSTLFCARPQPRFPHRLSATTQLLLSAAPRANSSSTSSSQ